MDNKNLLTHKIKIYDNIWNMVKEQFVRFAFEYRLKYDTLFKNIIASLQKEKDIYNYVYAAKKSVNVLTSEEDLYNQMIIDAINAPTASAPTASAPTASAPTASAPAASVSAASVSAASASAPAASVPAASVPAASVPAASVSVDIAPKRKKYTRKTKHMNINYQD